MPQSTTSLDSNVSGTTGVANASWNAVTFDAPYVYESLENTGNTVQVPTLLWWAGTVHYRIDNAGNVWIENPNSDGSLPV